MDMSLSAGSDLPQKRSQIHFIEPPLWRRLVILGLFFIPLIGTLAAIDFLLRHYAIWRALAVIGVFCTYYLFTALGVTGGLHRFLTHKAFKAKYRWVKYLWLVPGSMAFQGSLIGWTANHRKHHALAEQLGDPHSPYVSYKEDEVFSLKRGLWEAHFWWLMRGVEPDLSYVKDLLRDKDIVRINTLTWLWWIISFSSPYVIGFAFGWIRDGMTGAISDGWLFFLWGGLARIFLVLQFTWSVNSISHAFGARDYETGDQSRNNLWVAFGALGEGWHNNHHKFQTSARHGFYWWQFDVTWYVIKAQQKLGLITNVIVTKPEDIERHRLKKERGMAA